MNDSEIDTLIDTLLTLPDGWKLRAVWKRDDSWYAILEGNRYASGVGDTARAAIEMAKSEATGKDLEHVR